MKFCFTISGKLCFIDAVQNIFHRQKTEKEKLKRLREAGTL